MTERRHFKISWHETNNNENLAHSFDALLRAQKHFLSRPKNCLSRPVYDCSIKIGKRMKIFTKFTASVKGELVAKIFVSF